MEYKRNCPDCGNEIFYKTKKFQTIANNKNSSCIKCAALKKVKSLSKDKCYEFAKLCSGKYDFMKKYRVPYNNALKNGWLEEFFIDKKEPKWNKENSKEIALLYKNRKEFEKGNHYVYKMSCRNGWIDEICQHMEVKGNKYKRLIYLYLFPDNHVYVGLTYDINKRNIAHLGNSKKQTAVSKHIKKTGLLPKLIKHTEYLPVEEARLKEGEILNDYKNKGFIILNESKTGAIGGNTPKWNIDMCIKAASLCKTSKEFRNNHKCEYWAAQRNGWLAEITSHLIRLK